MRTIVFISLLLLFIVSTPTLADDYIVRKQEICKALRKSLTQGGKITRKPYCYRRQKYYEVYGRK